MPEYRRLLQPGGTYFFTVVTYKRQPLFADEANRALLHTAWQTAKCNLPFETVAICLLPDHLHTIWRLPPGDDRFSIRWAEIKGLFSKAYLKRERSIDNIDDTRKKRREASLWQRRFWEHLIRDEADLQDHLNYIHYNPVKHGLVNRAVDWPYSSFPRFVKMGVYEADWGQGDCKIENEWMEI